MDELWVTKPYCRLCQASTQTIAELGSLALTCVFPHPGEHVPRIPLSVARCPSCGLIQLGQDTDPSLMYTDGYGYKSGTNESMVRHLTGIVAQASAYVKPGGRVLDIGCNDGTLLTAWEPYKVVRYGIDPCASFIEGAIIKKGFFEFHDFTYSVITSIAMFYDLTDPVGFAQDIAQSLEPDGVWILEVQYAGAIQQGLWDGICHEHLTYYGLRQIRQVALRAGLSVLHYAFNSANGGSIRCVLGRGRECDMASVLAAEEKWDWSDLGDMINMSAKNVRKAIGMRECAILGASTKGNSLLQMAWLDNKSIDYAVERNLDKIGRVTPGTNIPIVGEEYLRENPPAVLLVLPYHFRSGILERYADMRERGVKFLFPLPSVEEV